MGSGDRFNWGVIGGESLMSTALEEYGSCLNASNFNVNMNSWITFWSEFRSRRLLSTFPHHMLSQSLRWSIVGAPNKVCGRQSDWIQFKFTIIIVNLLALESVDTSVRLNQHTYLLSKFLKQVNNAAQKMKHKVNWFLRRCLRERRRKHEGVNLLCSRRHFRASPCFVSCLGEPDSCRRPRLLRVADMSAAAPGTSKAAHSDGAMKKKKGPGALATAYLVIYNVVMTAG